MKLNFWQWLGIILLVIGAIGYALFRDDKTRPAPTTPDTSLPAPATQPVP